VASVSKNLPAKVPTPTAQEILEKVAWHLAWVNTLTAHLTQLGFTKRIRSVTTPTGRVLLMIE
jgi:hypothetical protein